MKAVLLDLDDTLYPEIAFVEGGFRNVARFVSSKCGLSEKELFERQLDIMRREGRGKIFDVLLQDLGQYVEYRVSLLVYLYRCHTPTITLYEDVIPTFQELRARGYQLGVITDGLASVQRRKIEALKLDRLVDIVICTDDLGKECWKPSVISYQVALDLLGIEQNEAAYVGNDVSKDFAGPNELGMLTIQIARHATPMSGVVTILPSLMARHVVDNLNDILPLV